MISHSIRLLAAAVALGFAVALPSAAQTSEAPKALTPETASLKKALEQKFQGMNIREISKSPYFGLYEVLFDDQIVYTDAKATYVLIGSIYDATTKQNMTEAKRRKMNRVAWNSLPFDLAFKRVKGDGSRKLAIFSDADCPFCAKLEEEMKGMDNVTIYTFLYPLDQLHPDAARKSKIIWCAPDRQQAWDEFFASGALPDNAGDCGDPVAATNALGQKLRMTATPTLVFADGSIVPGALPLQRLEAEMAQAEAEVKKVASAAKPAPAKK